MNKTKRFQYSMEAMEQAVDAVQNGMPTAQASKLFKVPRTTIIGKVKGEAPIERKIGPDTVLTSDEEKLLVKWMFHIATCGFPATKLQLIDSVQLLLKHLNRPNKFTNGRPGRHWYEAFMRRHPELSQRVSQNLTNARATLTEAKIRRWFQEVKDYLTDTNNFYITTDPSRIYNCDESAFFLSPKNDKVLVRKGEKAVYSFINNDEKECLTTLVMCSASGELPPPMIVYSYKRVPKAVIDKIPPQWGVGRSENGWMTGETFYEYVANIFHPWLVTNKIEMPVILFVDGHTSHLTMAVSEFCGKNEIVLISFIANATHILQPLDVAVFRPLKMEWKKSIHTWRMKNNGKKLARDDFAPILQITMDKMKNFPDIIKNGFRTCGLVPFRPDNINFGKYFKDTPKTCGTTEEEPDQSDQKLLDLLEKKLPEKLELFKASGETWKGAIEDTSMYYLWRSLNNKQSKVTTHITAENSDLADADDFTFNEENMQSDENVSGDELDITGLLNIENLQFPLVLNGPDNGDFQIVSEIESVNNSKTIHIPPNHVNNNEETDDLPNDRDDNELPYCVVEKTNESNKSHPVINVPKANGNDFRMVDEIASVNNNKTIPIPPNHEHNNEEIDDLPNNRDVNELPPSVLEKTKECNKPHNSENLQLPLVIYVPKANGNDFRMVDEIESNNNTETIYIPLNHENKETDDLANNECDKPSVNTKVTDERADESLTIANIDDTYSPLNDITNKEKNSDIDKPMDIVENKAAQNLFEEQTRNKNSEAVKESLKLNNEENISTNVSSNVENNVPSPFKKTLFWPTPKPNTTKRKITEKVPAVASSKEWQEYFKRKEAKKNIELAKKEQCAQKRKERQAAKAELQNKKMKKAKDERKLVEEQNDIQEKSSSNENIIENNEESEKTLKDSNSQELSINDYVIVNYNEQPLPGKIIGISCKENGEFEYKVSHMEKNGLNWIWPKRFDILWYDRDEVLEKIKEPKIKNKRGLYCVPEISDSVFI